MSMVTLYTVLAAAGGTVLVCQFLLTLIGLGGEDADAGGDHGDFAGDHGDFGGDHVDVGHDHIADHHVDMDHADQFGSWFFAMLSVKSIVAAVAFFGLGGLIGTSAGLSQYLAFVAALAAGAVAMFIVAWLMNMLHKLSSEGNVRIESAVGETATVYLGIPPNREGAGKVTVKIQDRTMEYQAVTMKERELRSGERVTVVGIVSSDTLEVEALP